MRKKTRSKVFDSLIRTVFFIYFRPKIRFQQVNEQKFDVDKKINKTIMA